MPTDYYHKIRQRFIVTVISVLLVMGCLFWWQTARERHMAIRVAERNGISHTAALTEHAEHVFAEVDSLLKELVELVEQSGGIESARRLEFHQMLVERTRNELQFSAIQVMDRNGSQIASSVDPREKKIFPVDNSSFRYHRDTPDSGMIIIPILPSADFFSISRAIRDADGRFSGFISMLIDSAAFEKLYREIDVGPGGRVILATAGGEILSAVPALPDAFKTEFRSFALFSQWLPVKHFGVRHVAAGSDGGERIIAYRKIINFPVVAVISYSMGDVLAVWHDHVKNQGIIALILTLLALSIAHLFLRQLDNLKTAHLKLHAQNEELEIKAELLDAASDAILLLDTQGQFVYFNNSLQNMSGYSREELQLRGLRGIEPTEYAERVQSNIDTLLEKGETVFESAYLCKSGSVLPIEVHARVTQISGRTLVLSMVRDISERKAIEHRLLTASAEWQDTFDAVEDSVWLLDMDRVIIRANKASQTIFGTSSQEIVGLHCCQATFGEIRSHADCPFDLMLLKRKRATSQLTRNKVWYEVSVDPIFDASGSIVRAAYIVKNIDGLKRAEHREQVRSGILERIAGGAPLPQLMTYICEAIEKENAGMLCSILLVSDDGLHLVNGAAPSLPDFYVAATQQTAIGEGIGSCGTSAFRRERVIVGEIDGHPFWKRFDAAQEAGLRSCWSEPIFSSTGALLGVFAIYHRAPSVPGEEELAIIQQASAFSGIAIERSKGEAERVELEHQLSQSQKMEAIGHLSGGIAHDFNNLLTPILIYSDLLKRSLPDNAKMRSQLDAIIRASGKARDLTQQLLSFGRKQVMKMEAVDLNDVVISFDSMVRRTLRENISLSLQLASQPVVARADSTKLEQVLLNLILNSQDAIAANGSIILATGRVLLDDEYARRHPGILPGDFVVLSCTDNGCGMDNDTMARMFEPFFSTKTVGHGTGLGLSNVYGIVKQHGGSVVVNSCPGVGTTFTIYLPVCAELPDRCEARQNWSRGDHYGNAAILLVEDNEMVRVMSGELLESFGYTVISAEGPERALQLLRENGQKIDMVITDVVMPGMDGQQLYNRIAAERPDVDKVLYISGYTNNKIDTDGELESGVHFLQKPFSADALMEKVTEMLQG